MVQSTLLRKASLTAPPVCIWEVPLSVEGVTVSIHHKSGAHRGRIAVHWTVRSRVPSRLLSVRGGVQLQRQHTSWHKGTERERRKKERGPEKSQKRGERPHLKWKIIRVRRKGGGWRKKEVDNDEMSRKVQFPLFLLLPLVHFPCVCSCHSHVNSLLHICLCDCGAHFPSIFDLFAAALGHGRPRWINLTFGPVVLFTFDRIYHCCHAGYPDAGHLTLIPQMVIARTAMIREIKSDSPSIDTGKYHPTGLYIYPGSETID